MNEIDVYNRRSDSSHEYFRSFITFYYYTLFNENKNTKELYINYYKSDKYY